MTNGDLPTGDEGVQTVTRSAGIDALGDVVPKPVAVTPTDAEYRITRGTTITVDDAEARPVGRYLSRLLGRSTDSDDALFEDGKPTEGIFLSLSEAPTEIGDEGYELTISDELVTIRANGAAGLFAGVQTLRQLLPPSVETKAPKSAPWTVPGGEILDHPRFDYRGAHLDVARHFFDVAQVKQYIDYLALYKLNHFHIHLTDDQGWRIEIESWPELTEIGASTEVGGGDGGYYTQEEYEEIVSYAKERYITVVPEIDVPGHTNAALASYDGLNPDGEATEPYTGIEVGFSGLDVDAAVTYEFLDDVIREVAAMTPGPFVHIGGDEVEELTADEYARFLDRATTIVENHGKRPIGWHESMAGDITPSTIVQYWADTPDLEDIDIDTAVADGHEFVLSPANHTYLDIKYDADTELGLDWAGHTSVEDAYDWDPASYLDAVDESAILGIEAALWSETLETIEDIEFMLFPRLPAIAERAWTPADRTDWEECRQRLANQKPRWDRLGIEFYPDSSIQWKNDPDTAP